MTTIAHISDLHFGRLDEAVAESLVGELHQVQPDLVVISGDITQRARDSQFQPARAFISRLPIPQIIVPGNHDFPLFNVFKRILSPRGQFDRFITADEYPEFENDDVHVVGICTACRLAPRINGFWKDGKIRPIHLQKLSELFKAGGANKTRILVAHHPFIEPPGGHHHGTIHGGRQALPELEKLGVGLILGGHIHLSYYGDARELYAAMSRPIYNILAGSATSTRVREPFNAYNLIALGTTSTLRIRARLGGAWADHGDSIALPKQ